MLENDLNPAVSPNTIYLKDYQAPKFLVPTISLEARLDEQSTTITVSMRVKRNGGHNAALLLNGEKMTLNSICIDGQELDAERYTVTPESLTIAQVPDEFELQIQTIIEPQRNTELSGLYKSSGNFCTQCEAQGFRRITYFPDRPDVLTEYKVKITANKANYPVLLSNGNPVASGDNDDGTHWAAWHDPHPKPCYLFALVAGDLAHISDQFITASGNTVRLNIYTQSHNIEKCQHAMDSLKRSMLWDEQVYGREYDLDVYNIVAVDDFNMGAMENKGLNIFNSKYVLANQQTATDSDYEGIESVIGHEYFHNWSGNRVTCRDWFQLSLKEGFTVFRDQEFSADMGSRAVKRIRDVQLLRAYQFKEDAGPMAHPIRPDSYQEINNFYTVTIYEKGAEVIRMMRSLVGVDGFRKGTDYYFDRFDGQAVTTEDFVQSIEQANNIDLSQFRRWYTQSGTPIVTVKQAFSGDQLTLSFSQTCPPTPNQASKEPFQIPIVLALFDQTGEKLKSHTLVLEKAEQQFTFDGLLHKPVVSLLRDFSAPIKLVFEQSDDELAQLIKVDDNGFSRWEAMQRLSLNLILPAIRCGEIDKQAYQRLLDALLTLVNDSSSQDKAILAEMLTLPSASYIVEQCDPIDPLTVAQVRDDCITKLARDMEPQMRQLFKANSGGAEFSLSGDAMARRSLKNRALNYLVATEKAQHYQLALTEYSNANNMTDRLAAFGCLLHSDYPDKSSLLEDFYGQWKSDTLVLDKWFAMQALAPTLDVLDDVKRLLSHPAFSMNNPNKVRSLLGAFASNLVGFHRLDGAGYIFHANRVIDLNKINPQIAARLVGTFNNWKAFAEPHRSLMKAQLERINKEPELAKDVTEIVSKALS